MTTGTGCHTPPHVAPAATRPPSDYRRAPEIPFPTSPEKDSGKFRWENSGFDLHRHHEPAGRGPLDTRTFVCYNAHHRKANGPPPRRCADMCIGHFHYEAKYKPVNFIYRRHPNAASAQGTAYRAIRQKRRRHRSRQRERMRRRKHPRRSKGTSPVEPLNFENENVTCRPHFEARKLNCKSRGRTERPLA